MSASDEPGSGGSAGSAGGGSGADPDELAARSAALVEANERLVVSMMLAQTEAEAAAWSLREATRLAELDPLTGLPNRVLLLERFTQAIAAADRHHGKSALLFIDLDHFKALNDSLGHAAGDKTLKRVAQCLLSAVRKADTVSRFGGDEFLVLLAEVSAAPGAGLIAAKIIAAIADVGRRSADAPSITASIGISLYPDDGHDAQTLMELADAAMYRAKAFGGGYFLFHSATAVKDLDWSSPRTSAVRPPATRAGPAPAESLDTRLRDANEALLISSLREREQRERAEEDLDVSLEAVGMGGWNLDLATDRISVSSAVDRMFGHWLSAEPESLSAFVDRFVESDREPVARTFRAARATGTLEFERRVRRANDGSLRSLHFKGKTLFEQGAPRRIVGVVEDESDRRSVEAQRRQSQKTEAVGPLTDGLAHDFNNLLLVMSGNLELLERCMPADDRTKQLLAAAREAVAGGAKLGEKLFPLARERAPNSGSEGHVQNRSGPGAVSDGKVVLVVDDNADVRAVTGAMLDELGYLVIEATSAQAALDLLAAGAVVDVVFSDVVMPVTGGVALARAIRQQRPDLPVLLTSGYTAQHSIEQEVTGGWRVLQKPYTQATLSTEIRNLLKKSPADRLPTGS